MDLLTYISFANFALYHILADDKFVKSGDNITLQCSLLGNSFRWMKDSRIHLTDNKKYDGTSTSSLTVINTDRHDTGRYSCNVFTSLGVWRSGTDYRLNIILNGNWSKWSKWSECSKTCGGGVWTKSRSCTDPSPLNGGLDCILKKRSNRNKSETDIQLLQTTFSDVTIGFIMVGIGFTIIVITTGVLAILCNRYRKTKYITSTTKTKTFLPGNLDKTEMKFWNTDIDHHAIPTLPIDENIGNYSEKCDSNLESHVFLPIESRYEYFEIDEELSTNLSYDNANFSYEDLIAKKQYLYLPINQSINSENIDGNPIVSPTDYSYIDGKSSFQLNEYGYIDGNTSFEPIDYGYIDGQSSFEPANYDYIDE
ncbi:UNC5 [Mytilus edulis]|uniref:UNC5 n=1 Tax=Mytilus edulis TaxID=6550 RepID=A0A8S3R053_MYTED|nr:UNC5 [Mytilus edulis]